MIKNPLGPAPIMARCVPINHAGALFVQNHLQGAGPNILRSLRMLRAAPNLSQQSVRSLASLHTQPASEKDKSL